MSNRTPSDTVEDFKSRSSRIADGILTTFTDAAHQEPATKADIARLSLLIAQLTIAMRAYSVPVDDEDHKIWFETARDVTKAVGKAARAIFDDAGGLAEEIDE